jgi:HD superfamily phosphohydrolase
MKLTKRIRTVLNDDQRFSKAELELLHTPSFQRLYDLHQLGLSDRVFLDASHSRLHHVIGVVEQAHRLMETLAGNLQAKPNRVLKYTGGGNSHETSGSFAKLLIERIPAARLMALLHDLTHAPYGHTLEDEIHLVEEKHDEPERQADAFYRLVVQFFGWLYLNQTVPDPTVMNEFDHANSKRLCAYLRSVHLTEPPADDTFIRFLAKATADIIQSADERRSTKPYVTLGRSDFISFIKHLGFAMRAMLFLDVAHKDLVKAKNIPKAEGQYPFEKVLSLILAQLSVGVSSIERFVPHRDAFMLDVIGNTICADLLDYAKRDAQNAGLKLDYDPARIIENFTLVSQNQPKAIVSGLSAGQEHPFQQHSIRTAISLFSHKLRPDVPGELLNLLQVRYYVYERVLFHPTKCIAGAMMGAAVQLVGWKSLPSHFRFTGDAVFLHEIMEAARMVREMLDHLPPTQVYFDSTAAELLLNVLAAHPVTSLRQSAQQLVRDRILTVRHLGSLLENLRYLKTHRRAANALLSTLKHNALVESGPVDGAVKNLLLSKLESGLKDEGERLLAALLPTVVRVKADIDAGLGLLCRLSSRQYYKQVFRFLPNVSVPGAENFTPGDIAERFLNSATRYIAEREIELRSGVPTGSVVIHCPKADGPKKIANILITSGIEGKEVCQPLWNIGKLLDPMFVKHEEAIKALQDMYASMWRLVISVSPEHTTTWRKISDAAGEVLYEILSSGNDVGGPATNDPYMMLEIENSMNRATRAETDMLRVIGSDGSEHNVSTSRYRLLTDIAELLQAHPSLERQMTPNIDGSELISQLRDVLNDYNQRIQRGITGVADHHHVPHETVEAAVASESDVTGNVATELELVLRLYKDQVAEDQWEIVNQFRGEFLARATADRAMASRVLTRLKEMRIPLLPKEAVEKNRAPASTIVSALNALLRS